MQDQVLQHIPRISKPEITPEVYLEPTHSYIMDKTYQQYLEKYDVRKLHRPCKHRCRYCLYGFHFPLHRQNKKEKFKGYPSLDRMFKMDCDKIYEWFENHRCIFQKYVFGELISVVWHPRNIQMFEDLGESISF
jgi:DNA replication protein DnaC